jgi:hypothetical protein
LARFYASPAHALSSLTSRGLSWTHSGKRRVFPLGTDTQAVLLPNAQFYVVTGSRCLQAIAATNAEALAWAEDIETVARILGRALSAVVCDPEDMPCDTDVLRRVFGLVSIAGEASEDKPVPAAMSLTATDVFVSPLKPDTPDAIPYMCFTDGCSARPAIIAGRAGLCFPSCEQVVIAFPNLGNRNEWLDILHNPAKMAEDAANVGAGLGTGAINVSPLPLTSPDSPSAVKVAVAESQNVYSAPVRHLLAFDPDQYDRVVIGSLQDHLQKTASIPADLQIILYRNRNILVSHGPGAPLATVMPKGGIVELYRRRVPCASLRDESEATHTPVHIHPAHRTVFPTDVDALAVVQAAEDARALRAEIARVEADVASMTATLKVAPKVATSVKPREAPSSVAGAAQAPAAPVGRALPRAIGIPDDATATAGLRAHLRQQQRIEADLADLLASL